MPNDYIILCPILYYVTSLGFEHEFPLLYRDKASESFCIIFSRKDWGDKTSKFPPWDISSCMKSYVGQSL